MFVRLFLLGLLLFPAAAFAQDTDRDSLSDASEQQLLDQFAPQFMVGQNDCSNVPAEFTRETITPRVRHENGTIYGQVFPAPGRPGEVEIHFYHLWRVDCGEHGHPLDTEHVAVLVRPSADGSWKALYWYAAAHEDTVCDVSQITRAEAIHAESHGPRVWISPGKHASYLAEALCQGGCGADRCVAMHALPPSEVINLGEPGRPMNGSSFTSSSAWPLLAKMEHTNFAPAALARLNELPREQIALYSPGRHPAQGIIAHSAATEQALATSAGNTTDALGTAQTNTGNALTKSFRKTRHALGTAAGHTVQALTPGDH